MQGKRIAETCLIQQGGRIADPLVGHAQNANAVKFQDRVNVYMKALRTLPETHIPSQVILKFLYLDSLRDNGVAVESFNGRNAETASQSPVIDFGVGAWPSPLDSYVNPNVRLSLIHI